MGSEGWNVDVVALLPLELLRQLHPLPFEGFEAVELHVPMQVVAGAFDHEDDLLPHVPVLARALARLEELHIGFHAAFARVEAMVDEVLDQAVGRALPRHVLGFDDVGQGLVARAEVLRSRDVVGVKGAGGGAGQRRVFVLERHWISSHSVFRRVMPSPQKTRQTDRRFPQISAGGCVAVLAGRQCVWRPFHDLLEQEVHEQEQRLCLEHQQDRLFLRIVVEVLVDAAVLDDHHVARLPGNVPAVVHVMAAALEYVEHRAVEVAVLLAVGTRRIGLDMRLHRLDDGGRLRADDALAVLAGASLPRHLLGGIDPLLLEQRLVEVAVRAFQRPHEGALLCPALPLLVLLLLGIFVRLVVADAWPHLFVHACHSGASLESAALGRSGPPVLQASFDGTVWARHYGITRERATLGGRKERGRRRLGRGDSPAAKSARARLARRQVPSACAVAGATRAGWRFRRLDRGRSRGVGLAGRPVAEAGRPTRPRRTASRSAA